MMRLRAIFLMSSLLSSCLACSDDVSSTNGTPSCNITSPAGGSVFAFGDTVTVKAEASDPGGGALRVEFYVNQALCFTDRDPPYEYSLDGLAYRIGDHSLAAAAVNEAGKMAVDTVEVSVGSIATPVYGARVIAEYGHDPGAFTQGLLYDGGYFYEGTGIWGQSSIRKVDIETGDVLMRRKLPNAYFGEGIAVLGEMLYQLTWTSRVGFIYNKADFDSLGSFAYETEGWGLTTNGETLMLSDGTSTVYFLEPSTFEIVREMIVRDKGAPVTHLNEMEYIEGDLFANVLNSDRIARISLEDGSVVGWIDLKKVADSHGSNVLNGIAYDAQGRRLFVTGKNWDTVYEITPTY